MTFNESGRGARDPSKSGPGFNASSLLIPVSCRLGSTDGIAGVEHGSLFNRRACFAKIWPASLDRFKVFLDAIQDFVHRVGMVERGAKEGAALQAARKLSGKLLHTIDRRRLGHVFAQQ